MPVYEIVVFPASEAFSADPSALLKPGAEFLSTVEGCRGLYGGTAEEDRTTGYIIIIWETFAHHQALMDSPGYPQNVRLLPVFADGTRQVYHVDFNELPDPTLAMPATELLTLTLKEGKTNEDLASVLSVLAPKITAEEGCTEPLAWGPTREDPSKLFLSLGWVSSKRHFDVVGQESYKPVLGDFFNTVDLVMHHISFTKAL